jgi:hypothetical protein
MAAAGEIALQRGRDRKRAASTALQIAVMPGAGWLLHEAKPILVQAAIPTTPPVTPDK